jgi:hypothetical protein
MLYELTRHVSSDILLGSSVRTGKYRYGIILSNPLSLYWTPDSITEPKLSLLEAGEHYRTPTQFTGGRRALPNSNSVYWRPESITEPQLSLLEAGEHYRSPTQFTGGRRALPNPYSVYGSSDCFTEFVFSLQEVGLHYRTRIQYMECQIALSNNWPWRWWISTTVSLNLANGIHFNIWKSLNYTDLAPGRRQYLLYTAWTNRFFVNEVKMNHFVNWAMYS